MKGDREQIKLYMKHYNKEKDITNVTNFEDFNS